MEEPIEPEQRRKFLEVIDRHTGRMERLVRDLLRLARLDAQQETADVHPLDVATLFRSVSTDLSERIEGQHLRIDVKVDPAAAIIEADPTKIHDALRNLIENAVNYSADGGRIELERGPREIACCCRSAISVQASPSPIWGACSSASIAWTSRALAILAAPASGYRSCATWSSSTAAK